MKIRADQFEAFLAECDEAVRGGRISQVNAKLRQLNFAKVSREHCLPLARICRRTGFFSAGLKLLAPAVRKTHPGLEPATPSEVCEYAAILTRVGLVNEALNLLEGVDRRQATEAALFEGFCRVMIWDYAAAIAPFEDFIRNTQDPYLARIARVNLASAFVATGQFGEGRELLSSLIADLREQKAIRLMGNCLELRAQTHFYQDRRSECEGDLREAEKIFGANDSYDQLLVKKWNCVLRAMDEKSPEPLVEFKAEALRRKHWESAREADLFALKIKFDQSGLDYLYFGTPFPAYRDRILRESGGTPSATYDFGGTHARILDLAAGEISGFKAVEPSKKVLHLAGLLLKDFYLPSRTGSLFAGLYPNEYFDVHSSPMRVRQVMRRLRGWIRANRIPLTIDTHQGTFRMTCRGPFTVRLAPQVAQSKDAEKLIRLFPPGQNFAVKDAADQAGLSRTSFLRLAGQLMDDGVLERSGVGKAIRYKFKKSA